EDWKPPFEAPTDLGILMADRLENRVWVALVFSMVLIAFSSSQIRRRFEWRFPVLTDLVVTENYTGDLGALLLGSHRLAADLAYIQFLQYYGEEKQSAEAGHEDPKGFGGGHY